MEKTERDKDNSTLQNHIKAKYKFSSFGLAFGNNIIVWIIGSYEFWAVFFYPFKMTIFNADKAKQLILKNAKNIKNIHQILKEPICTVVFSQKEKTRHNLPSVNYHRDFKHLHPA